MSDRLVVVGSGLAAVGLVTALRAGGSTASITAWEAAAHPGEDRPPLSKGYLADPATPVELQPDGWWEGHGVQRRHGVPVVAVERGGDGFVVTDADGRSEAADTVVLA
uniref:FAD-dependent oxidoreductase n=1 Tax=Desertihabitans aurantiacus TaxID=2282477 RepID=UPI0018E54D2D